MGRAYDACLHNPKQILDNLWTRHKYATEEKQAMVNMNT